MGNLCSGKDKYKDSKMDYVQLHKLVTPINRGGPNKITFNNEIYKLNAITPQDKNSFLDTTKSHYYGHDENVADLDDRKYTINA